MNRKKQFTYLALLLIIVTLPNLVLIGIGEDSVVASPLKKLAFFVLSLAITIFPLFVLKPKYYGWFTIILFPFLIFELSLIFYFKSPSSEESIATLFLTNYNEVTELINGNLILLFLTILFLLFIIWLSIKLKKEFILSKKQKLLILLSSISVICILQIRNLMAASKLNDNLQETISSANYSLNVQLHKVFPLDILLKSNNAYAGVQKKKEYKQHIKNYKFNAVKNDTLNEMEVYVLVIGETARKHNFKIYGYHRETTPNLDTISNLTHLTNVNSAANITSLSIPFILTRATPLNINARFDEPAVLNAFKEAGFKTYWITNQSAGVGSVFGFYSSLADVYKNTSVSLDAANYDNTLFPVLDTVLKDATKKKFIVIHTLGSHFRYNYRYPETFNRFKPSLSRDLSLENTTNISSKKMLINSYDNSILYTDYILSNFMRQLDSINACSYLYYISDHGENLYDDENNKLLHGYIKPTRFETEIPLIIWTSNKYKANYPLKVKNLKSNQHSKISSAYSFHTLLDMANIKFPTEDLTKSFTNSRFDSIQNIYLYKTDKTIYKFDSYE